MKQVTKDLEWKNIDHEVYRSYTFSNGHIITIKKPILINVSDSGGHRILDSKEVSHYIPPGWIHLHWETNDDNAFRF